MSEHTMKSLTVKVDALENMIKGFEERVKVLEEKLEGASLRDRGPSSTRKMTDEDARRIIITDLKDVGHKKAAEALGLSYGQIYSARGGYTFKNIHEELAKIKKESK